MRKHAFIPLILAALLSSPALANEIKTDSTITAATVYANRAAITRTANVQIPAGAHTVIFKDLPVGLYPDSLRVEGKGNAPVTLGALSHKTHFNEDFVIPREKALNDRIRELEDKKLLTNAEIKALEKKKEFYESLIQQAGDRTREEIADFNLKPDQWAAAADTMTAGMTQAEETRILKTLQRRDIDEELNKLRQDLNQLRTGNKQTYQVSLPVEAARPAHMTIELSYQMGNATWRPVYDARLDTKTGTLDIIQYGAVTQHTGEDWPGIALTLSTARPQRGASLPPLQPMWLDLWKNEPMSRMSLGNAGGAEFAPTMAQNIVTADQITSETLREEMKDSNRQSEPVRAKRKQAVIDTGGFTAEYKIPGPSEVLADGTESKLLVGAFDANSEMQIHVKPQLSDDAFLVSKMLLKGESPILPGQVSLFRDGAFVGQDALPLLRPGKAHNLYFGIDDQIDVARRTLKEESGEEGLLGRDNVRERRYVTTIQNLRKKPVKLAVTESTPVGRDEKIDIEILKNFTTPGYTEDIQNKKGVIQWVQDLQPDQTAEIKLGWKVAWPKNHSINGL